MAHIRRIGFLLNAMVVLAIIGSSLRPAESAAQTEVSFVTGASRLAGPASTPLRWSLSPAFQAQGSADGSSRDGAASDDAMTSCTVTSTADSGAGTLRACLEGASPGDTITFDTSVFPPTLPATIALSSALPDLVVDNLALDGSTAGVILDGSGTPAGTDGLLIDGVSHVVVKGLQILGFPRNGIVLQGGVTDSVIGGTNPGGGCLVECNLISGNGGNAVLIMDVGTTRNTVRGNYIGTDISGTAAIANGGFGVHIGVGAQHTTIGGDAGGTGCSGACNLISGNDGHGVSVRGAGTEYTVISGNWIGVDASGTFALPNAMGISIVEGARYTTVGGPTPAERNVISGNADPTWAVGVRIYGSGTMSNTVRGNYIGTDASGIAALGNGGPGGGAGISVTGGASLNAIGGDAFGEGNLISGNLGEGVVISDSGTVSNTVSGNTIGVDVLGTAALPNQAGGVRVNEGASGNLIGGDNASPGGTCSGACNLIGGNVEYGVQIQGVDTIRNTVRGNYVGTDASGMAALPNGGAGVEIIEGADYTLVGSDTSGERNLISGNGGSGVVIRGSGTMSNTVSGNYVGVDVGGTTALPNQERGVYVYDGASYNLVGGRNASPGGACSGACNLISGNVVHGVHIEWSGTIYNVASGNYIGTDVSGTAAIPNGESGVEIDDGATYTMIGGDTPGERNLISGNSLYGVVISDFSEYNTISGNDIGVDASGTAAIGNLGDGVRISGGSTHNLIGGSNGTPGGSCTGECNLISGNGQPYGYGVRLWDSGTMSNTVSGNYIGTDLTGSVSISNASGGIELWDGPAYNLIGGSNANEGNLISGNQWGGLYILGAGGHNRVVGNTVGVGGPATVGNGSYGIVVAGDSPDNVIEGNTVVGNVGGIFIFDYPGFPTPRVERAMILSNTVADNGAFGIRLDTSGALVQENAVYGQTTGIVVDSGQNHNALTKNSIYGHTALGIDLLGTANDRIPRPTIVYSDTSTGLVTGTACAGCRVEVFSDDNDEGRWLEGTATATLTGIWSFDKGGPLGGTNVNATATDADGNTSEFSGRPAHTCTVTSTADSGPGTLRSCLEDAIPEDVITFDPALFAPLSPATIAVSDVLPELDDGYITIDASDAGVILDGSGIGSVPETMLLDDVRLTLDGGPDLIVNGDFGGGLGHWRPFDDRAGATRSIDTGDYQSAPNSYHWDIVAYAGESRTVYDTTDTSSPVSEPFDDPGSTVWISATGGSELEVRFWHRFGTVIAIVHVLQPWGEDGIGEWWSSSGGAWVERVIHVTLPPDASAVGIEFQRTHALRWIDGLRVTAPGNTIRGLQIVGFPESGIDVYGDAQDNLIGGDSALGQGNLLSNNGGNGVEIRGSMAMSNTVSGNQIGTDASGTAAWPNTRRGVRIYDGASYNIVGGMTPGERNLISGNRFDGVQIEWGETLHNTVIGNYIGTDVSGASALPNGGYGIEVDDGAGYTRVGGNTPGERNVISGNSWGGVSISDDSTYNTVSGNYVGTDATGTAALGNAGSGIQVEDASNNLIGGSNASPGGACTGACNVVSGNGNHGVGLSGGSAMSNTVSGNYVGIDVDGTAALGNQLYGVDVSQGARYNVIGGTTAGERNVISGQTHSDGVWIGNAGTSYNLIVGNCIGTDASCSTAIPNADDGLDLADGAMYNRVGGPTAAERNVISGNRDEGIFFGGGAAEANASNVIVGNYIGTDATGVGALGNGSGGIGIYARSQENAIGGSAPGEANRIAYNNGHGMAVYGPEALRNTISRNSIHNNVGKGIALADGGNLELAAPEVMGFDLTSGVVTGTACANCTVEVFSDGGDEGETYEGTTTADVVGEWSFAKGAPLAGPNAHATATDADGNTSEFSPPSSRTVVHAIPAGDAPPVVFAGVDTTIDCASGPGGTVSVTLHYADYDDLPDVDVLSRYWEIVSDFDAAFICDLTFGYEEGDLNGVLEEELAGAARWDEGNSKWDYVGGAVDTSANTVTISDVIAFSPWLLITSTPLSAVSDLGGTRSGNDLQLAWSAVTQDIQGNGVTPDHYVVYRRADEPYFTPQAGDIIATPLTPAITDPGILGDPTHNHYYAVTAVDGAGVESAPSNRLGAFDQALTPAVAAGERAYNLVALNLEVPGITDADALAAYVGDGVYMVLRHDAATQGIEWRLPGLAGTNFPVEVGGAYFLYLDDTAPSVVSLVGGVPAIGTARFDLARPDPGGSCTYNFISVPLHKDDLTDADALAADIGGVYSVSRYNAETQDLTWRLPGVSGENFPVRVGYPYIACLDETAPPTWP